jgi:hypothetical protein
MLLLPTMETVELKYIWRSPSSEEAALLDDWSKKVLLYVVCYYFL